jgi:hypothetical protein
LVALFHQQYDELAHLALPLGIASSKGIFGGFQRKQSSAGIEAVRRA